MPANKPDPGVMQGIGSSLHAAYAPDSPVDPDLRKLIREVDGVYLPDEVSEARVNQLLKRLVKLPWDKGTH